MNALTKILLLLLYPLLILARVLNALFARDPLRLREPADVSLWIERGAEPSRTSYFSEASEQEGRNHRGFGRWVARRLTGIARLLAPSRTGSGQDFRAAADREKDIPDEVYTLW